MKDNPLRREHAFSEVDLTLGGSDLTLIQPPFSILPIDHGGGTLAGGASSEDVVIDNVSLPTQFPCLPAEINFTTDDKLKEIGISIDDWSFTASPTGGSCTINYRPG